MPRITRPSSEDIAERKKASTGITKANIRFYEAQGLIQPGRTDSGYRSYCPEDVEELKRVPMQDILQDSTLMNLPDSTLIPVPHE